MYMSHIYAKEEEHTETDQRSIEKERRTQPSEQQRKEADRVIGSHREQNSYRYIQLRYRACKTHVCML